MRNDIRIEGKKEWQNTETGMWLAELSTERLLLRQLNSADAPEIVLLRSDPRVNEFIGRDGSITLEEARLFIDKIRKGVANKESLYWAIALKGHGTLIGTICLWNFSADKARAEVGYELSPAYQRQGFMQEALEKVIEYGFGPLKLKMITALLMADNIRSIKLLKRNGFQWDAGFEHVPEAAAGGLAVYWLAGLADDVELA